jgi:hypothetical protein
MEQGRQEYGLGIKGILPPITALGLQTAKFGG